MKYIYVFLLLSGTLWMGCFESNSNNYPSEGVGGSTARFAIQDDYLYIVDWSSLRVMDISEAASPQLVREVEITSTGVETIFPFQDKLFFGTQSGMYIYDISVPDDPKEISFYEHVISCDPVVVDEEFAYVTLRSAAPEETQSGIFRCDFRTDNQLEIIDIRNPAKPTLVNTHSMFNPRGLGIDDKTLFVCDGSEGLKVFNVETPTDIKSLATYDDIAAFDVIPFNDLLLVIGQDGLVQYDYSDVMNLKKLSEIRIGE